VDFNLKRYEKYGWDYEHTNPLTDEEIAWYLNFAQKTGGPVLELACGTARLLVTIAQAGLKIEGIDLSKEMLKIAKERVNKLSPEVVSRILLHNMDMTSFKLDRRFSLIVIADNSFGELKIKKQQLSCLKCVYHHLQSDGKFLVTVRRFDSFSFLNGQQVFDWSEPVHHPVTNELVMRRGEMELLDNGERLRGTFFYKIIHRDGSETMEEYPFEVPVMSKEDYIALFSEAGFRSNVYVGYQEQADDGKNPILCFVCDKAQ